MNPLKKLLSLLVFVTALKQAFRYLDPGTGSLIAQVLIALIAGSVTTFVMFRDQILYFLRIKKRPNIDDLDDDGVPTTSQDKQ